MPTFLSTNGQSGLARIVRFGGVVLTVLLLASPLALAPAARADDESARGQIEIGSFLVTGSWAQSGDTIRGEGTFQAPWGSAIRIAAEKNADTGAGRWSATFDHPLFGRVAVTSGRFTSDGLEFTHKATVGGGRMTFQLMLSGSGLRGEATGTMRLGKVSLGKVRAELSSSGDLVAVGDVSVRLPGVPSAVKMQVKFDHLIVTAAGSTQLKLGRFKFDADATVSSTGQAEVTGSGQQTIPGIGSVDFALSYANSKLTASGSKQIKLGELAFDNTQISIDGKGAVTVHKEGSYNIPGLGSTNLTLSYANGQVSASGTRTVSLGSIAFDNTAISVSSNGTITATKAMSYNIPGLGSTNLTLSYANGQVSASGTRTVSLGSIAFDNTAISVSSNGTITATKAMSYNIPGLGSTNLTLSYANGQVSASGTRTVSLGSIAFDNTAISVSSNGTITATKAMSYNIPGLGSTNLTLSYANGQVSASGTRTVSLGSIAFDNTQISVSSNGTITVDKQVNYNIPNIGSTNLTLVYANGQVSASGSANITVSALGVSVGFPSVAVNVSSNGTVSATASKTIKVMGISHTISISYSNGSIHVSY